MKQMKKKDLAYVRFIAIALSCIVASLTLCNLLTVVTHGIELHIPDEDNFSWAIDPVGKEVLLMTGFSISNHGAYDIDGIDIRACVITEHGDQLLDFREDSLSVSSGTSKDFRLILNIDLEEIDLVNWLALLYRDTTLSLIVDIDADYMFGLIHITVDEVLEYPWSAPLSGYAAEGRLVPGILAALGMVQVNIGEGLWEVQSMAVEYLMGIDHLEYLSNDGYGIEVNGTDKGDGLRQLTCDIVLPIPELDGTLELCFTLDLGLDDGRTIVNVEEVRISYAAK